MSQDGFGIRTRAFDPESGEPVEVLTFAPVLTRVPDVASVVGDRVAKLARVRHAMYARARKLDRMPDGTTRLVSDYVAGWRLDQVLEVAEREKWTLDISAVTTMMRQLIPAVALFSRHQRDAAIGTVGPERLILTPQGRLVIAEYVLAPGLEQLHFTRERLWREFRVAVPQDTVSRIPPSADVIGIGVVAISLLLGRRLKDDEFLVSLGDLFDTLTETTAGSTKKLSSAFCTWIARALQFEPEASYQSVQEAQVAFEETLAREKSYVTTAAQLDRFIAALQNVIGPPQTPGADEEVASELAQAAAQAVAPLPASVAAAIEAIELPAETLLATPARRIPESSAQISPYSPKVSPEPSPAPLEERTSESSGTHVIAATPEVPPWWKRYALPALAAVTLLQFGAIAWLLAGQGPASAGDSAVNVQSRPAAARVSIDGEERGITPFQTSLAPGSHVIEVRAGRAEPRVIPVVIREGVETSLYVELQSVVTVGGLEVRSEPAKARVTVGGQYRGDTPLVLKDLPPGDVEVLVQGGSREVKHTIKIEPGIISQLVVPLGR